MALVLADRVQETTTTAGTGTVTLAGAVQGYQSFAAVGDGSTTYYTIAGQGTSEWEVGYGTYTASGTTLSRTTVLSSSNSGSLVNFSGGAKNVFVTYPASQAAVITSAVGFGFKNRLINGGFGVFQRSTSATITAGSTIAAGYSTVDRWYVYCTGANVTAASVAGVAPDLYQLQVTGAASVTAIGIGQRIENVNSADLAGNTCMLSATISNSLLTTVTWTAYYANTANTFGTLASPTRTQIATGTFTVTSTATRYIASIAVPAAATTGIEIVFTVGAQTSGTWKVDNVQLEKGLMATAFDIRPYGTELALCQRYYYKAVSSTSNWIGSGGYVPIGSSTTGRTQVVFPVQMRIAPTVLDTTGTAANYRILPDNAALSAVPSINLANVNDGWLSLTTSSGLTGGGPAVLSAAAGVSVYLGWGAEL